ALCLLGFSLGIQLGAFGGLAFFFGFALGFELGTLFGFAGLLFFALPFQFRPLFRQPLFFGFALGLGAAQLFQRRRSLLLRFGQSRFKFLVAHRLQHRRQQHHVLLFQRVDPVLHLGLPRGLLPGGFFLGKPGLLAFDGRLLVVQVLLDRLQRRFQFVGRGVDLLTVFERVGLQFFPSILNGDAGLLDLHSRAMHGRQPHLVFDAVDLERHVLCVPLLDL